MPNLTQQTKPIKYKQIIRKWHLIDCKSQTLGRISTRIAQLLIGKNKVNIAPYLDSGDYVVVINVTHIKVTGNKLITKKYTRYSGYPGGLKVVNFEYLFKTQPDKIIKFAIWGMLPKNKLRQARINRLFIYQDDKHPHKDKFVTNKNKDYGQKK